MTIKEHSKLDSAKCKVPNTSYNVEDDISTCSTVSLDHSISFDDKQHEEMHDTNTYLNAVTQIFIKEDFDSFLKKQQAKTTELEFISDLITNAEMFYREGRFKYASNLFLTAAAYYSEKNGLCVAEESAANTNEVESWDPPRTSRMFQRADNDEEGMNIFMDIENVKNTSTYINNNSVISIVATLLYNAGQAKLHMKDYGGAFLCFERARKIFFTSNETKTQHQIIIQILHNIGRLRYRRQYDLPRAISAYKDALDFCEAIGLGSKHLYHADTLNCLGVLYAARWWELTEQADDSETKDASGLLEKSLNYLQESLVVKRKLQGSYHKDVGSILNNLGCLMFWQDEEANMKAAIDALEQSIEIRRTQLGTDSIDYATVLSNLGYILMSEGNDYGRAFDLCQKALLIFKSNQVEHRDTMETIAYCAMICYHQDDYDKALEMFEETLQLTKKLFGEFHKDFLDILSWIGLTKTAQGDFNGAVEAFQKSLSICENVYKPSHSRTLFAHDLLADIYCRQGDHDNALRYYEEILRLKELRYGHTSVEVANAHHSIGEILKEKNDLDGAQMRFQEELRIKREKCLNTKNEDTELDLANVMADIGGICILKHDVISMMKHLTEAARIYQNYNMCIIENIPREEEALVLYPLDVSFPSDAPAA